MKSIVKPTSDQLVNAALDIHQPEDVEIDIRSDGKVVWVNVDGICLLRIGGIPKGAITIEDRRKRSNHD